MFYGSRGLQGGTGSQLLASKTCMSMSVQLQSRPSSAGFRRFASDASSPFCAASRSKLLDRLRFGINSAATVRQMTLLCVHIRAGQTEASVTVCLSLPALQAQLSMLECSI